MIRRLLDRFIQQEQASGLLLVGCTLLAILIANTSYLDSYHHFLETRIGFVYGPLDLDKSVHHWINDALMALFFFVVGLEIRREFTEGELRSIRAAILPLAGALGGMLVPAGIFLAINMSHPENWSGWAIPSATDIAFAVSLLAMLGKGLPAGLRIFLLALAILDDLGGILVIAIFYAGNLEGSAFLAAGAILAVLLFCRFLRIQSLSIYAILGICLWIAVSHSGVHATLSGIILAFLLPRNKHLLERVEDKLHGWVAFIIVPLFAFANAGLVLTGIGWGDVTHPLSLGIFAGLFLGKQGGVMLASWLACKSGLCRLPHKVTWRQLYGAALLTGIGFTMSLFIGSLAFSDPQHQNLIRLGVIAGSLASSLAGGAWLFYAARIDRRN